MKNKSNYEFLLKDLTKLNGVGKKTAEILKKKKLTIYLIYFGDCLNHIRIELKVIILINYR